MKWGIGLKPNEKADKLRSGTVRTIRYAFLYVRHYNLRWRVAINRATTGHRVKIELAFWLAALAAFAVALPALQAELAPLVNEDVFPNLQELVLGVGAALIGATAIVASFVLFAMQVNVERLPYGLFVRFSSDWRLLATFAAAFTVSIAGSALSLIINSDFAALVIVAGIGSVLLVLRLLLQAYQRSLILINPVQQLRLVQASVERQLGGIERHIRLTIPLMEEGAGGVAPDEGRLTEIDQSRLTIFQMNRGWDKGLREAVSHAVAFARRAGEQGDVDISAAALATVISLNRFYIRTKGKTFFANQLLIENPLVTDGTINHTLEDLKRLYESALARKDEIQTRQIYQTYLQLTKVYLTIEYSGLMDHKTHASLTVDYLERAVMATLPLGLVDTVMIGVQALGEAARCFLALGRPDEMTSITDKIGTLACSGALREDLRPITLTAMEQLSETLLAMLRVDAEIGFATEKLTGSITFASKTFLSVPDQPHSMFLGPVYSGTSVSSFRAQAIQLVNALINAEADNAVAATIADNLESWADHIYVGQKELLLLAVEKRSMFAMDMIHWITSVSEILVAAAYAPATREHAREALEKHALWLFGTLTFIPRDFETARWVEGLSFIENVFRFAVSSANRSWEKGFDDAWALLLSWGLEAGREANGWGTLEHALEALTALALRPDHIKSDQLQAQLRAALDRPEAPDQEIRDHTARTLRERAETIRPRVFEIKAVDRMLNEGDIAATRKLLRDLGNILSPATADEPVHPHF